MNLITRTTLILGLAAAMAAGAIAQETSTQSTTTAKAATSESRAANRSANTDAAPASEAAPAEQAATAETSAEPNSYDIRNRFVNLLGEHPPELSTILVLDPTLLSNEGFLASYPELAKFVADHPGVRRNPRFYLSSYRVPGEGSRVFDQIFEAVAVGGVFLLITFAVIWLVRTLIEQRRWTKLSRTQSEVHNKILDRFSTSEELLEYVRSPAGTKFLESAPIPLHAEHPPVNAHLSRVMWSIQLGVILMTAAVGMLLVSTRLEGESSQGMFAMGFIGLCIGVGFVGSAIVTLVVSRRLGLTPRVDAVDDSSTVRRSEG